MRRTTRAPWQHEQIIDLSLILTRPFTLLRIWWCEWRKDVSELELEAAKGKSPKFCADQAEYIKSLRAQIIKLEARL